MLDKVNINWIQLKLPSPIYQRPLKLDYFKAKYKYCE